ncbi:MAG: hypothetical protein JOZ24_10730 [Candidatus Eremiobacteraeota bacterium]|nr:hypothetical protein [Candidatus Eremiobacteraeota bacterium]
MYVNRDFSDLLREFSAADVRYLLVGAHALAIHAEPRATGDLDVWVANDSDNAHRVYAALATFGAPLHDVSVDDFTSEDLIFQMGVVPHRIDVITTVDGVRFEDAWVDRVDVTLDGIVVPVIGRRAFLTNKRAAGRPKDLADIELVLRHHPEER